jgi:predicted exporter
MSLLVVTAVYVACYPLAALSERLLFTSDLVKLLPSDREREPERALAAMTTEAMDTY